MEPEQASPVESIERSSQLPNKGSKDGSLGDEEELPPLIEDFSVSESVEEGEDRSACFSALAQPLMTESNTADSPRVVVVINDRNGASCQNPRHGTQQKQLRFEGIDDEQLAPLSSSLSKTDPDPPKKKTGIVIPASKDIDERNVERMPDSSGTLSTLYTVCQCMSEWVFGDTFSEPTPSATQEEGRSAVPMSNLQRQQRRYLKRQRYQRTARRLALADILFSWASSVPVLPPELPSSGSEQNEERDFPLLREEDIDHVPSKPQHCKRSNVLIVPSSIEVTSNVLEKTEASIRVNPDLMYRTSADGDASSEASTASSSSTISSCVGCPIICNKSLFPPPHQIQELDGGRIVLPLRQQFFHCPHCQQRMHSHCAVQLLEHLNHQKCPCCRQSMISKVLLNKTVQRFQNESDSRSGASSTMC